LSYAGEHYYLTPHQFEEENRVFGNDGNVPMYVIYDPSGKVVFRQVGYDGMEKLKTALTIR